MKTTRNVFSMASFNPLAAAMQSVNSEVSNYDNEGAVAQLQKLIDQEKAINLKFYTGRKDGKPSVWIEEATLYGLRSQGFKVIFTNLEQVVNLFLYVWNGKPIKVWMDDSEVTTPVSGDDFQLEVFKMAVTAGLPVTVKPAFLTRDKNKLYATLPLKMGTIMFSLNRSEAIEEFLEHPSISAKLAPKSNKAVE